MKNILLLFFIALATSLQPVKAQEFKGTDKSPMDMAYFPDNFAHDHSPGEKWSHVSPMADLKKTIDLFLVRWFLTEKYGEPVPTKLLNSLLTSHLHLAQKRYPQVLTLCLPFQKKMNGP